MACGAFVAGFAAALAALALPRLRLQNAVLTKELRISEKQVRYVEEKSKGLQGQVELLTAMREVTRVVSEDVDFERILEHVLKIVEDLVEAEEMTLYLLDEESEKLVASAQRKGKHTHFGKEIMSDEGGSLNLDAALEHHDLLCTSEGGSVHIAVPLRADREVLGVLTLTLAVEGTAEEKTQKVEHHERSLREMGKHISLAIKTTHLHDRAVVDGLTRLYTKQHFRGQLEAYFDKCRRHKQPLALIMLDIDHFKSVNDTYGHLTGDVILAGVARALKKGLRKYDSAYRCGGEEMALLLPETTLDGGLRIAERLRKQIQSKTFTAENREKVSVTISLGVADFEPTMDVVDDLISRSDQALYAAKRAGRNRVVAWDKSL
ncbi:MAG: diguanylate cyclase, partial [Planctomycetes bacterium]|nr:diguanylate cyclase [Planctomycetota bacterium]